MKVWIVVRGEYKEGYEIDGVYAKEKDAQAAAARIEPLPRIYVEVEQWEVQGA